MSMNEGIRWEAPPEGSAGGRGKFDADEVFSELHDNPGEWGILTEDVSASYVHTSPLVQKLKDKGCEVRSAKVRGVRTVYARFLPQGRRTSARQAA